MEWRHDTFVITTDPARIDPLAVHGFLRTTYWASDIPEDVVRRSMEHSLCFGLLATDGTLLGFARAVTDRATFAYLCDVFIAGGHRGRGLGDWLVQCVLEHPDLQGLRRMGLVTRDAHGLYSRHGFAPLGRPERHMERLDQDVYKCGTRTDLSTPSSL
jgi:GNAT superfamily N-acetyltransferase